MKYFILDYRAIQTLFRLQGEVHNRKSLEAYFNGSWSDAVELRQYFMRQVMTGWLDDDDSLQYDEAIIKMASRIAFAKEIALKFHGIQKYGNRSYQFHLEDVIAVLNELNISASNEYYIDLHIIAWLHDALEDTNIDAELISRKFGQHILEAVQALSDGEGKNRKEKKAAMMKNLVLNQSAIIVKLADRISNVRISIQDANEKKLSMYKAENASFTAQIENSVETKEGELLLRHLRSILN